MTNEQPYLILHKVRGKPAFDIAIKLQIGDEEGWIISTSGHRAYPWLVWNLATAAKSVEVEGILEYDPFPPDWPDHYSVRQDKSTKPSLTSALLTRLGLGAKPLRRI